MVPSTNSAGRSLEIVTISTAGVLAPLDDPTIVAASTLIAEGGASAVCLTHDRPAGEVVVGSPCDVLVADSAVLKHIPQSLRAAIASDEGDVDPAVAMLDLQWRLTLFGHRVVTASGGSAPATTTGTDTRRRTASALNVLHSHIGAELQGPMVAAAQLYVTTRDLAHHAVDTSVLDLQRSPGNDDVGSVTIPAEALGGILAVDLSLDRLKEATEARVSVQAHRRVRDRVLGRRLLDLVHTLLDADTPEEVERLDQILGLFGVKAVLDEPLHILIASPSGSAVRVDKLTNLLGEDARIRVLRTESGEAFEAGVQVEGTVDGHAAWADVMVLVSATLDDLPGAEYHEVPLVADLSTMDVAGWLLTPASSYRSEALRKLMGRADLVLAADAARRDLLLGALAGQGRVNPAVYDDDPTLLSLVCVDPKGEAMAAYCRFPVRAADSTEPAPRPYKQVGDLSKAVGFFREGGAPLLLRRAAGRVRRLAQERARRFTR